MIPSEDSPVQSKIILTNGISYKIRASGEIPVGGPAMVGQSYGDTEYLFKHTEEGTHIPAYTNTPSITSECPGRTGPTDMGIGIDDQQNDDDKFPFWGPFENSHVYSIDFVGKGAPIILNYHDCLYGDNFGRLKIEIFKPLPPPPSDIWGNPLTTAIVVGVLGIVGTVIGTILQRKKSKSKSQSKARLDKKDKKDENQKEKKRAYNALFRKLEPIGVGAMLGNSITGEVLRNCLKSLASWHYQDAGLARYFNNVGAEYRRLEYTLSEISEKMKNNDRISEPDWERLNSIREILIHKMQNDLGS